MNIQLVKKLATTHYDGDEEKAKQLIKSSRTILEAVAAVLKDREAAAAVVSPADYNCPSWAYKQADANGFRRGLSEAANVVEVR